MIDLLLLNCNIIGNQHRKSDDDLYSDYFRMFIYLVLFRQQNFVEGYSI